jgi:ribosomal protein S18 acetylase RimI-like enzyme
LALVRGLMEEYARGLEVDLCFQQFDRELASLPGDYAAPSGRLLLAWDGVEAAGCVGLRRWTEGIAEMKRLYVRPRFRGGELGSKLVRRLVSEARSAGYSRIRLDTLPSMHAALHLYASLGFQDIAPYRENPIPGARYLELRL